MQARTGDRIIVQGRSVGTPTREGTVLEVRGDPGEHRYRVSWDDGTESVFMPTAGVATVVERGREDADRATLGCTVDLLLRETDGDCLATATLRTGRGTFSGEGHSRRRPGDPQVPLIGEELAIARALSDLGEQLQAAAADALERHEDRPIHLIEA